MRLRVEISLGIGALLLIQVVTSIVATRLLTRMGPALEVVMQENVVTLEAGEDILARLAEVTSPSADGRPAEVEGALRTMRAHITEPDEPPVIDRIERDIDDALGGDPDARRRVVRSLDQLAEINRAAMSRADQSARRMGLAGAWASVLLGLASFWASVATSRRLRNRLDAPLAELDQVLQSARRGERLRRASVEAGPAETRRIADNLNWLLDRQEQGLADLPNDSERYRALSLRLIDELPDPVVVVTADGELLSASRAALARLDPGGGGLPKELRQVPPADPTATVEGWTPTHLAQQELWLWRFVSPADPPPAATHPPEPSAG